uniref:Capsid protein n=1 Tax=Cryptotermes secundus permutotetra-like virus 1 TaxID=3133505 RepID=A0AAT9JQ45_9VIRU
MGRVSLGVSLERLNNTLVSFWITIFSLLCAFVYTMSRNARKPVVLVSPEVVVPESVEALPPRQRRRRKRDKERSKKNRAIVRDLGRMAIAGGSVVTPRNNPADPRTSRSLYQLASTPTGVSWVIRHLHPNGEGVGGGLKVPDGAYSASIALERRDEFELKTPLKDDTWTLVLFCLPVLYGHTVAFVPVSTLSSAGDLLYDQLSELLTVLLVNPNSTQYEQATYPSWLELSITDGLGGYFSILQSGNYPSGSTPSGTGKQHFRDMRRSFCGMTCELNAPALSDQGRIIAGQFAPDVEVKQLSTYAPDILDSTKMTLNLDPEAHDFLRLITEVSPKSVEAIRKSADKSLAAAKAATSSEAVKAALDASHEVTNMILDKVVYHGEPLSRKSAPAKNVTFKPRGALGVKSMADEEGIRALTIEAPPLLEQDIVATDRSCYQGEAKDHVYVPFRTWTQEHSPTPFTDSAPIVVSSQGKVPTKASLVPEGWRPFSSVDQYEKACQELAFPNYGTVTIQFIGISQAASVRIKRKEGLEGAPNFQSPVSPFETAGLPNDARAFAVTSEFCRTQPHGYQGKFNSQNGMFKNIFGGLGDLVGSIGKIPIVGDLPFVHEIAEWAPHVGNWLGNLF